MNGTAGTLPDSLASDLEPLFEAIVKEIKPPSVKLNSPLQMLVTNLDYDDHKGRIAIGRVSSGCISRAEQVSYLKPGTSWFPGILLSYMRNKCRLLSRIASSQQTLGLSSLLLLLLMLALLAMDGCTCTNVNPCIRSLPLPPPLCAASELRQL